MESKPTQITEAEPNLSDASAELNENAATKETATCTTEESASTDADGPSNSIHSYTKPMGKKKPVADYIPKHLWPKEEMRMPVEVPIENYAIRGYSPAQVARLREALGLIDVNSQRTLALRDLGDQAMALGPIKTIQGATLFTQDILAGSLARLHNIVQDDSTKADGMPTFSTEEKMKANELIGELSKILAGVNNSAIKREATIAHVTIEADRHRKASFAPGKVLTPKPAQVPTREAVES